MLKRLIALGGLAVVAMAAPATAQQYPPAVNSLTINDTTPCPGQLVTVQGRTFAPGGTATVVLTSGPVTLGSATADAASAIALQATIPADTPPGAHTITATGPAPNGQTLTLSLAIRVAPAGDCGASRASGGLPRTGDDTSIPLAKIGLGLLALGGVIYSLAAKRRKALSAVSP
jgi:LPXTG-motif cell wall-anchored protein